MKAKDICVNVVDFNGELFVMVAMKINGTCLKKENGKVNEISRKDKIKQIQSTLKDVDFK